MLDVLKAVAALLVAAVVVLLARAVAGPLWQAWLRRRFERTYGVPLAEGMCVRLRPARTRKEPDGFALAFPRWEHANADGTSDRRFSDNRLVRKTSSLEVGAFRVACDDPRQLYALVERLRESGTQISLCPLEAARLRREQARREATRSLSSREAVYQAFCKTSWYGFEELVAELLRANGWRAETTAHSGDGGYDILAWDLRGRHWLVECKCFEPSQAVGRPQLQKLAGANTPPVADALLFVTTAGFTHEARAYAAECGMRLMDGDELVALLATSELASCLPGTGPADERPEPWHLTTDDLLANYPPDAIPAR